MEPVEFDDLIIKTYAATNAKEPTNGCALNKDNAKTKWQSFQQYYLPLKQ